jgi:hypothetical protein
LFECFLFLKDLQFAGSLEPGEGQTWRLVEKGNRAVAPIYISMVSLLKLLGTKMDVVSDGKSCWLQESKNETSRLAKLVLLFLPLLSSSFL